MTKSIRSIGGATSAHLAGQVLFSATALLWAIVVARSLGVEGKGTVSAALLCASLIGAFGMLGTREGLAYYIGKNGRGAIDALLPSSVLQSAAVAFVGGLLAIIARTAGVAALQDITVTTAVMAGFTAGLVVLSGQLQTILVASSRVVLASSVAVLQMGTAIALFLGIRTLGPSSSDGAVWAYSVSLLGGITWAWLAIRGGRGSQPETATVPMRSYWKYCLKAMPTSLAHFLNLRFDQAVIAATVGATGLGLYSAAVNVAELGGYPAASLSTIVLPAVARSDDPGRLVRSAIMWLAAISAVSLVAVWTLGPLVINLLFGADFAPSVGLLRILVTAVVAFGMARVAGSMAAGLGSPAVGTVAGLAALAITIPGCIWLIPKFGVLAAAWTSVVAYCVALLVASLGLYRVLATFEQDRTRGADIVVAHLYSDFNAGDAGITQATLSALRSAGYSKIEGWSTLPGDQSHLRAQLPYNEQGFSLIHPTMWGGVRDLRDLQPTRFRAWAPIVFMFQGARGVAVLLWPRIANLPIWTRDEAATLAACKRARIVVSKGGGFIYCEAARQVPFLMRMCLPIALAGKFAGRVILFGQTIGPLHGFLARWIVRKTIVSSGAIIVAREEKTATLLGTLGIPDKQVLRCPDTAFLLRCSNTRRRQVSERRRIAISVRPWMFPGMTNPAAYLNAYYDAVGKVARVLLQRGSYVTLVAQVVSNDASEDDRNACNEILKRFEPSSQPNVVSGPLPPARWIEFYGEQDIVVATRAHSAVFALDAGTPVVAISYGPKGIGIMESAGLGGFAINIEAVTAPALLECIDRLDGHCLQVRALIREKVENNRSDLNRIARELFKGGIGESPQTLPLDTREEASGRRHVAGGSAVS